jgi:hypothetical protein
MTQGSLRTVADIGRSLFAHSLAGSMSTQPHHLGSSDHQRVETEIKGIRITISEPKLTSSTACP